MDNFKLLRGRINYLEDENILSLEIYDAIKQILNKCPDAIFGGSIALDAVGLLKRKISDIDVFFPKDTNLAGNGFLDIKYSQITSDTVTDTNGEEIQRTGTKIGNVKCCCFKVSEEELQHSTYNIYDTQIKIQNVNYAIQAKISYSERNPKHKRDLEIINSAFDNLLSY